MDTGGALRARRGWRRATVRGVRRGRRRAAVARVQKMKKQPFECEALDGEGRNEKTKNAQRNLAKSAKQTSQNTR